MERREASPHAVYIQPVVLLEVSPQRVRVLPEHARERS